MKGNSTVTAARRRTTNLAGDSLMLVIGVYGRIDWTIASLARARHPMLPAGDAYLRFMEEREDADLGALASTSCRHVVKRRKSRDVLTGEVVWTLSFQRPHAMFSPSQLLHRIASARAGERPYVMQKLPKVNVQEEVSCDIEDLDTTAGRNEAAVRLRAARRALAARVAEAHR